MKELVKDFNETLDQSESSLGPQKTAFGTFFVT